MTVTEEDWLALENAPLTASGRSTRRIHAGSPHDIFISVAHPSRRRMLFLQTDAFAAEGIVRSLGRLPQTAGLELALTAVSRQQYELQVVLTADDLREVFTPLVTDIAEAAKDKLSSLEALVAVVNRFDHWQNLLRSIGREGLGAEARRGLFGELLVLRDLLLGAVSPHTAVESWVGPTSADQDFQLSGTAVEVKTTSAKATGTVRIASERQLDDTGLTAMALALVVVDERRGGLGQSLNGIVDEIRDLLASSSARRALDGLLVRAGYLPVHRDVYDEPRYTLRDLRFWRVTGSFPRIVESALPEGVSNCVYDVQLSGLDDLRLTQAEVKDLIREKND
ncbi:PD-(D/E)XK motif protein [Kitasatospora sp. MBT63]|uniref:PD-(D/E)XK motif protein n=1 Tax=Kitasatospora sp. MBT63 TaxID=1444768 RepID=UPI00053B2ABA|nr:PD-(D/E)XK motif protein [Kitasatospora sp. MBT63]